MLRFRIGSLTISAQQWSIPRRNKNSLQKGSLRLQGHPQEKKASTLLRKSYSGKIWHFATKKKKKKKKLFLGLSHSLKMYTSFVRPHPEYACPVWHLGISRNESEKNYFCATKEHTTEK